MDHSLHMLGLRTDNLLELTYMAGMCGAMPAVLDAMEHILHCPAKRLFSFTLPDKQLKELGEVTERYLICQLDQSFYALDFYKRLFTTS